MDTAKAILEEVQASRKKFEPSIVACLHEDGGCYWGERLKSPEEKVTEPLVYGDSAAKMRERLQASVTVSRISENGSLEPFTSPEDTWWRGGFEFQADSQSRAERVVRWLWSLTLEPSVEAEEGAVVIVGHGLFMDRVIRLLMGTSSEVSLLTANCAYWLFHLIEEDNGARKRLGVLASNFVEHVPIDVRTGHSLSPFNYCPQAVP